MGGLMLLPGGALPPIRSWIPMSLDAWIDKLAHLALFAVQVPLLERALRRRRERRAARWLAFALTLAYAVLLEAGQTLVPLRYWEPADLVADALGALLGVSLTSPRAREVLRL